MPGFIDYFSFLQEHNVADKVFAFSAGKGCHGTEPGIDAREVGVTFPISSCSAWPSYGQTNVTSPRPLGERCPKGGEGPCGVVDRGFIFIPRQTHSVNVVWTDHPGEAPDCDAAITRERGLCVAIKTADCIPVLLYDERQQLVAAVHAGWRGTVGRIVERTINEMNSRGEDLLAIIGPGISLNAFEVGDEVYAAFAEAGFPMERIARRYPASLCETDGSTMNYELRTMNSSKWHLDLWEANRWLLEQCGVSRIHTAGICTMSHPDDFYSARRETIKTGRNINGIMLL